jgi:leader peptidase (prepilin peptidase)/N-methyltransferase
MILSDTNFLQSLVGAAVGFIFFYVAYLIGRRLFGPGALGFGDVTLAMTMGAMLGFQRIFFGLTIGILLAGGWGLFALISGRMQRHSYFAYGPFLAIGGILSIIFGHQIYAGLIGS